MKPPEKNKDLVKKIDKNKKRISEIEIKLEDIETEIKNTNTGLKSARNLKGSLQTVLRAGKDPEVKRDVEKWSKRIDGFSDKLNSLNEEKNSLITEKDDLTGQIANLTRDVDKLYFLELQSYLWRESLEKFNDENYKPEKPLYEVNNEINRLDSHNMRYWLKKGLFKG